MGIIILKKGIYYYLIRFKYPSGATVTNNLFIHNEQEGIHLEVSTRLNINGNYFFGNKIAAYVRESSYVTVQNNMMMMSRGYSTDVFDGPRAVNVPGGCTCFNNLSGNKMVAGLYRLQKPANNTSNSNFFVSPNTYIGDGSKTLPAFISATGDDKLSLAYINKNPTSYTVDGATMLVRANSKIFTSKAQMDQFYSQMAH